MGCSEETKNRDKPCALIVRCGLSPPPPPSLLNKILDPPAHVSSLGRLCWRRLWKRGCWFTRDSSYLACFFSPTTLLTTFSHFTAGLKLSLALLFVSQSSLAQLCSHCFWRWSWRLHSWDSSVLSFIPFIGVRFCFKQIASGKLYSQKVPESVLTSETTLLRNVVFPTVGIAEVMASNSVEA